MFVVQQLPSSVTSYTVQSNALDKTLKSLCDTVSTVSARHSVSYNDVVRAVLHELELCRIRDVLTVKPLSYTYYDTEYHDTK